MRSDTLLKRRLLVRLVLLVTALVVGIGVTVAIHEARRQHDLAQKNLMSLSSALASEVARQVMWDDRIALHRVLGELVRTYPEVQYAFILRDKGPLVHTFARGVPPGLLRPTQRDDAGIWTFRDTTGAVLYDVSKPIPGVSASLHIGLGRDQIYQFLIPLLWRIVLLVALGILLGGLLSWVFAGWATREVERLTGDLRTSREFMQSIMDSMPFPLMVVGRNFEILHANRAMQENAGGFPSGTADPCHGVLQDREEPCEACPHSVVLATGVPVTVEQTRSLAIGEKRILEVSASPILDDQGSVTSVIKTIHDITERKQNEADRLQRVKLEGVLEMAGAACHEVGQPLQSLMALAYWQKQHTDPEDPSRECVDNILSEVTRLGEMVNRIMRITRYEPREYLQGLTIVDIEKSSSPAGEQGDS